MLHVFVTCSFSEQPPTDQNERCFMSKWGFELAAAGKRAEFTRDWESLKPRFSDIPNSGNAHLGRWMAEERMHLYSHRADGKGWEERRLYCFRHTLATSDAASMPSELRACMHSRSMQKGSEGVQKAGRPRRTPRLSPPVNDRKPRRRGHEGRPLPSTD